MLASFPLECELVCVNLESNSFSLAGTWREGVCDQHKEALGP